MKYRALAMAALLAVSMAAAATKVAHADSAEAICEVRKEGDKKKGQSGPCSFSQRQGYVDIDLRNGDRISLNPREKPGHFRDANGNKVIRSASGNVHEYKWENGKKVTVTFTR